MMTNYRRGVKKERELMALWDNAGAIETGRTAGSHGIFDVFGIFPNGVRFAQVKRIKKDGNWTTEYKQTVEEIKQIHKPPNVSYEYWIWEDYNSWIKKEVIK